jgi:hypothetical protein
MTISPPTAARPAGDEAQRDARVRKAVTRSIEDSGGLDRGQIAAEMTRLLGQGVTENMLNNYSSSAKNPHRFPLGFMAAFCAVTGCDYILWAAATEQQRWLLRGGELLQRPAARPARRRKTA